MLPPTKQPYEFYDAEDAEEAIKATEAIINFVIGVANASIRRGD
ncbi:HEPN domain-containing protein [Pyrococcus abyssi]|nr:HEPN domain-containing protein [Pyrococcus abyssi]